MKNSQGSKEMLIKLNALLFYLKHLTKVLSNYED